MTATAGTRWETVIGLEVHCQLKTHSKMFCSCSADYAGAAPNTHVCPVCLGMPGVLPVINEQAIAYIVMTGLALNCDIAGAAKFDRKNYPYPDLMKGYQISQYDQPICVGGWLEIVAEGGPRRIRINRVHMEEDTSRLLHRADPSTGEAFSLVDVNRAGSPLMEIVSEPDLATPAEAREYLVELRKILRYIGVSDANLEEGDFRCDANISLRRPGAPELGAKVEVKNMNSFRAVYDALAFEQVRQAAVLERGDTVPQETRGWVEARHETVAQRSKEYAHDYRYFPEPDLPPLRLGRDYVARLAAVLPELPAARRARFEGALGLSQEEAAALTDSRERADYFEELAGAVAAASGAGRGEAARAAAHWVLGEVGRWSNESGLGIASFPIPAERLAGLIALAEEGKVTGATAKQVFDSMVETGKAAAEIVSEGGLAQISGSGELREAVRRALAANERAVADYRAGKESAVKFLIGQVMRETRGRANPQVLQDLFKEELA